MPLFPNLSAALVAAQKDARSVGKDGNNKFHNYAYATAESVIEEGRATLSGAGLALMSAGRAFTAAENIGGDKAPIGRVTIKYRLVHESGESIDFESSTSVIPEKGRPADKAECAAVTSDLSYTLRGLLLLSRGLDDSPIDGRDDRGYRGRDDRADSDRTPEPAREPAPRDSGPAAVSHRSAGDHAAAAQTNVDQSHGRPVYDPAHVALCDDFVRRAESLSGNPGPLYEQIIDAKLPEPLSRRALLPVLLYALRNAPDVKTLDDWAAVAARLKPWGKEAGPMIGAAVNDAEDRLARAQQAA